KVLTRGNQLPCRVDERPYQGICCRTNTRCASTCSSKRPRQLSGKPPMARSASWELIRTGRRGADAAERCRKAPPEVAGREKDGEGAEAETGLDLADN